MISMPGSLVIRKWLKAPTGRAGLNHRYRGMAGLRFVVRIGFSISLGLAVALVGPRLGAHQTAEPSPDCPATQTRINLVFIIDRSGSLANSINPPHEGNSGRGQTYNVEIEGVRRALLDPSVIPRDGSVSVGAVLFDGAASVPLPLTAPINSDEAAQAIARQVETLHCLDLDSGIDPCPAGDTNFDTAIRQADQIARSRSGARRVFIMSTDGGATDPDRGVSASNSARENASKERVEAELDVILIGLPDSDLEENKRIVNRIVFPSPPPTNNDPPPIDTDLPGAVEVIDKTRCNEPNQGDDSTFDKECGCQVRQFADFTRRVLRSNIASRALTVTTDVDPVPSTPVLAGDPLSLRQAIEMANSNGGRMMITFDSSLEGKTIQPNVALPPLTAPDITICGCVAGCPPSIPDKVTCSQTSLSEEMGCEPTVTIDGQQQLEDGILIRSNRDVVRGLRIMNFRHAGIVIQPVCPLDDSGFNRIELNNLEDNTHAGICVLDPPPGQANAVTHNVGNTISMNDISGSETPIDLGSAAPFPPSAPMSVCDGPTSNDAGDADEGPNHLLNFPDALTAETVGNTVTITGKANGPGAPGSTVEIFAVQKFNPLNDKAAVTAVTFFRATTADKDGLFSVSGVSTSPILGYTATVTDSEGNTSELRTFCSGPALAAINPSAIRFDQVDLDRAPPNQSKEFVVTNLGCSSLQMTSISLRRKEDDANRGRLRSGCDDDSQAGSGFFTITPFPFGPATTDCAKNRPVESIAIAIAPGLSRSFFIQFSPVIPGVIKGKKELRRGGLSAEDVLPSELKSVLGFQPFISNSPELIVIGPVTTAVKLIDPGAPSNPAEVTLERSGDNLFVTFSVFDSNLDVNKVNYEFFKSRDGQCSTSEPVPAEIVDADLGKAIGDRTPRLVTGQSFSVIQRFSRANKHPEAGCVRVTVSDGERSVSATSLPASGSAAIAPLNALNSPRLRDATIVRPTLKLPGAAGRSRAAITIRDARVLSNAHKTRVAAGVASRLDRLPSYRRRAK
jgi:hypothetical protein